MNRTASGWAILRAHKSIVRSLGFSKDGRFLLSGDDEGYCCLWSLDTRRPKAIWRAHDNATLTTEFWPEMLPSSQLDGSEQHPLVLTHARDNKLRIWRNPLDCDLEFLTEPLTDSNSSNLNRPWLLYTQDINALNFCAVAVRSDIDDTERVTAKPKLCTGTSTGMETGMETAGSKEKFVTLYAAPATVSSEIVDVYSLDEHFQVSRPLKGLNASDAIPFEQQLEDEAASQQKRGQLGTVMALHFHKDILLAGYESGHIAAFNLSDGSVSWLVQPHTSPILSIAVEPEANCVLGTAANRTIVAVDLATKKCSDIVQLVHRGVASIQVSTDLSLAVTAGWDGRVRLFGTGQNGFSEIESFTSGGVDGITAARISIYSPAPMRRRLRTPPAGWVAVAGKDARVGLYAVYN